MPTAWDAGGSALNPWWVRECLKAPPTGEKQARRVSNLRGHREKAAGLGCSPGPLTRARGEGALPARPHRPLSPGRGAVPGPCCGSATSGHWLLSRPAPASPRPQLGASEDPKRTSQTPCGYERTINRSRTAASVFLCPWGPLPGADPPGPELGASLPLSLHLPRKVRRPRGQMGKLRLGAQCPVQGPTARAAGRG